MALEAALPDAALPSRSPQAPRRPRFARPHWTLVAGALLLVLVAVTLCLGPTLAPYDPTAQTLIRRLKPPSEAH